MRQKTKNDKYMAEDKVRVYSRECPGVGSPQRVFNIMKNQTKKVMRMVCFVEDMKLQRYSNAERFCGLLCKSDERNNAR